MDLLLGAGQLAAGRQMAVHLSVVQVATANVAAAYVAATDVAVGPLAAGYLVPESLGIMSLRTLSVGALVALVAWLVLPGAVLPGPRHRLGAARRRRKDFGRASGGLGIEPRNHAGKPNDRELLLAEVVALLRSGIPPGVAWRRGAGVEVDSLGLPDHQGLSARAGSGPAAAMVAAAQVALRLGAPLAAVLATVDSALQSDAQAEADRRAALAGPQATATVLMALPGLGLALGWVLGANPLVVMAGGGVGSLSLAGGFAMFLVGRWWISRLVATAGQAGAGP